MTLLKSSVIVRIAVQITTILVLGHLLYRECRGLHLCGLQLLTTMNTCTCIFIVLVTCTCMSVAALGRVHNRADMTVYITTSVITIIVMHS